MQKKLIAAAVAGLLSAGAGSALAAENVTLYGVADVYVGALKVGDSKRHTVINSGGLSGSRLGFKGAEDIGNGVKAIFTLEYGLDIDESDKYATTNKWDNDANNYLATTKKTGGIANARQTFAGLTGDFGTVVAGRLQTAGYDWAAAYDVFAGSTGLSTLTNIGSTLLSPNSNGRADNAIAYVSPNFGGFTFALNHARLSETLTDGSRAKDGSANLLGLRYQNGPLDAGLVYAQGRAYTYTQKTQSNADAAKFNEWGLGASYDFGVVKPFLAYQQYKNKLAKDMPANSADYATLKTDLAAAVEKVREINLGLLVPVGAGNVHLGYTDARVTLKDGGGEKAKTNGYAIGYTHGLSKRTTAYAGYSRIKNKAYTSGFANDAETDANEAIIGNSWGVAGSTATGGKSNVFAVGMRHAF